MLTSKRFNASALKETASRKLPLGSAGLLTAVSRSAEHTKKAAGMRTCISAVFALFSSTCCKISHF